MKGKNSNPNVASRYAEECQSALKRSKFPTFDLIVLDFHCIFAVNGK
jgi:hypothetical protein